ncbi:MAG: BolA/IbaG family iron-sulfur metabolism protein [Rhodanobacteraceae bacterium]|nr:BolA/IbaG family iron-sulfur metabolism protein [Rhodanobacteraceae bacterium]
MNADTIKAMIAAGMPNATISVEGADGVHFEALVIAPEFAGMRPLQRHRKVYETLGDKLGGEIHALSLKTLTPEEWAARG